MTVPVEYVTESVTEIRAGTGNPCWQILMRKPDGTLHQFVMPQSILEWRQAEYGITDVDQLLDIVLHEPWTPTPLDRLTARDDPATKAGMVVRAPGPAVDYAPVTLYTAENTTDAREAHLLRIADTKATRVHVRAPQGKPDPLDAIRSRPGIDPIRVQAKREHVDTHRFELRGGRIPTPGLGAAAPRTDRAARTLR